LHKVYVSGLIKKKPFGDNMNAIKKLLLGCTLLLSIFKVSHAAYPDQPIKIIVPFPAGGTTDVLARILAAKLSERVGQPVVVDNRAGSGGTIGAAAVAKSQPDGYTFILGTFGTHAVNFALTDKPTYHPLNDFAPVTTIAEVPNVLVVSSKAPYKTLAELIAAAKAKPGLLSHGSTGIGASPSLSFNVLKNMSKIDMIEVMYKGGAPALLATMGGEVTMTFDGVTTSTPHIKAGTLRPLAVSSSYRIPTLPDVPTVAESGYPGFDVAAWYGIWAPAKTPPAIIQKMNAEFNAILKMPDVRERFESNGAKILGGSVQDFVAFNKKEFERWSNFIRTGGIKLQN
jgi:tripartite-type tricarboxylate transporter receptor subunit TctC